MLPLVCLLGIVQAESGHLRQRSFSEGEAGTDMIDSIVFSQHRFTFYFQEFLDREKGNNDEIDKKLKYTEKLAAKMRLECQASEGTRIQVKDELETLKYTVDKCATDLESARGQSSHLGREIKDKRTKWVI